MTDVTDADRAKAQAVLGWDGVAFELLTRNVQCDVLEVAKALAEERAKARAPFLALAEKLEEHRARVEDDAVFEDNRPSFSDGRALGHGEAVDAIRQAAEGNEW